jgi:hypothetical protein
VFGASIAHFSTKKNQNTDSNNHNHNNHNHERPKVAELREAIHIQNLERENHDNTSSSSSSSSSTNNCPICEKYSQGPCGKVFEAWLKCTDDHPGRDAESGKDLHLIYCADHAQELADCLNKHQDQDYYDRLDDNDNDSSDSDNSDNDEYVQSSTDLKAEWERLIREEFKEVPRVPFPAYHTPQFELRPKDRVGVVSFEMSDIDDTEHEKTMALLLVFVQDATSGELLAAAMPSELWHFSEASRRLGTLQCHVPVNTSQLKACALYEDEDDPAHQVIYTYTANVPMTGQP